jgi:alkanesulfonate monooxygenase SsuD/methylene tetrahydromethanopterin reductase-like flavin-dependent oxidoreductase (luciferase family)
MAASGAGSESFRGMMKDQKERFVTGGGWPIIGTPEQVAGQFKDLHDIGITGFAMILRDYLAELPYIESALLPRLQRLGLRD